MRLKFYPTFIIAAGLLQGVFSYADVRIVVEHNGRDSATPNHEFKTVTRPLRDDLGAKAKLTIVDGQRDRNGGGARKLIDGLLPTMNDQPGENFFFSPGTDGGRLLIDLGSSTDVTQVNTYSWHPDSRGAQVYRLYASYGDDRGFQRRPRKSIDPKTCGWSLIAKVDARAGAL